MNCSNWRREISAWIDGALPPSKVESVRLHLHDCPDCAGLHAELRRMGAVFESARRAELEAPPFMWQRLQARIEEQERETTVKAAGRGFLAWFGVPQLRYALGASLLLVVTGIVAIRTRTPEAIDPETLSRLDAYTLEVAGNPFLSLSDEQNPFFGIGQHGPGNPFELGGVN